jgi:hypothetical protein
VRDHLENVSLPRQAGNHRGQTQFVASAPSEETDKAESKAGEAKLCPKRTIRPAYEARGHGTEEDVVDKVYEIEKTDWEQQVLSRCADSEGKAKLITCRAAFDLSSTSFNLRGR